MNRFCSYIILMYIIFTHFITLALANFVDGPRYKGWYYFETKPSNQLNQHHEQYIKRLKAKQNIEDLKNTIEEYKYLMLDNPTIENVKKYKEIELQMWDKATKLDYSWRLANILYPYLFDPSKEPVNSRAVKLKREQEEFNTALTINEFSKNYSLILFKKSSCPYSQEFEPVLKTFSNKYNFTLQIVDLEDLNLQPLKYQQDIFLIIQQLNIQTVPIVIAVSTNGEDAFELSRGYLSIPELEEYASLIYSFKKEIVQ